MQNHEEGTIMSTLPRQVRVLAVGLVAGATTGTALGLLFAPQPGTKTPRRRKKAFDTTREEACSKTYHVEATSP